ncbi:hypothetical protein PUN28_018140 [Cardiocondyla obscurior]|uniref:Uncharacterized protein n=1 Tax=Cardiocondyla obscurior TaxID=286306 RepID=A0AAW2EG22_9HYME
MHMKRKTMPDPFFDFCGNLIGQSASRWRVGVSLLTCLYSIKLLYPSIATSCNDFLINNENRLSLTASRRRHFLSLL